MRRITRNFVLALVAIVVLLLALGALPGLLATGDPYYIVAEPVANDSVDANATVNASGLSERRFPYTTAALDSGRSDAYYDGPLGFKEAFTHSPFDEIDEFEARNPAAVENRTAFVTSDNRTYRLDLVREAADGTTPTANTTASGVAGTTLAAEVWL